MIPQGQYNPELLQAHVTKLRTEMEQVISARMGLDRHWTKLMRAYRAMPATETKNFPFAQAANLVIPVVATDVDKTYAWIMALLFGQSNLWSVSPTRPDMVDVAPALQEFLQWAQHNELDVYDEVSDFVKELTLLGTAVLKTQYIRNERKVFEYREAQTPGPAGVYGESRVFERQAFIMVDDRPAIRHVPLWDIFVHPQATSMKDSPWVMQRIMLDSEEYEQRKRMGVYADNMNLGVTGANQYGPMAVRAAETLDRFKPYRGEKIELFECWTCADIVGDGYPTALVVTIHRQSGLPVRVDWNPYFNQEPPFEVARFVRQPKRFYGIGLGDMLYMAQDEISTIHNQRIDSTTVRTMPIFWALENSGIQVNELLFPGRILKVSAPNEFGAIPLATGALESTARDEAMIMQYHRERTGINDFVMGGDGPDVSYAAATTAVNQLREGKKRFDQTMREIRSCLSGVGTKVVELYQQFNQGSKAVTALGPADGALVERVLNFPLDTIRSGVSIDVAATSAVMNKEVEVRTNTLIMQLLQGHNQQMLQLTMQLFNPQMPPAMRVVIMQQIASSTEMMKRVLRTYDMQDADELVVNVPQLMMGGMGGNPLGQAQGGGAVGGGGGLLPAPDMGALPAGAPQAAGGRPF